MRYQLAKTAINNPAIDSPEWEKASVAEIAVNRWTGYAKAPRTTFQMLRSPEGIAVRFHTEETHLRAEVTEQNGEICTDSCVEFFLKPDNHDLNYLNFELNPKGILHLGIGAGRGGRRHLTTDRAIFDIVSVANEGDWTLKFFIPDSFLLSLFAKISPVCKANAYKCGDFTDHEHYGMWSEVETVEPDFHVPDFFGTLVL